MMDGLKYMMSNAAAVCTPGVSKKISIAKVKQNVMSRIVILGK